MLRNQQRKYLVSAVSPVNTDADLTQGIEITHWNGVPMDLAVARNANREAGSNDEARRARGLEALTLRWLGMSLPPDEDWVVLTYTDGQESRIPWQSVEPDDLDVPSGGTGVALERKAAIGLDVKTELLRRVRKTLFNASALKVDADVADRRRRGDAPVAAVSVLPDVYPLFGTVQTPSGPVGYVRLATFAPENGAIDAAVNEFVRILRTLPPSGLILDVRGNGGGYVNFGERILQTLSPSPITPEPFHFMATPFTLSIARDGNWLTEWARPLATSLATGAGFSQGFPVTDPRQLQRHRPGLPGTRRPRHRRVLLQHDGYFRGGVSGSRHRDHPRLPRQHRRGRRQRLGLRPARGPRPDARIPSPPCRKAPACGWRSAAPPGSAAAPACRWRISASHPTNGTS